MIGALRPARSALGRGGGEFSVPLFIPMGRILAIDYGQKRCGVAATDPLQITPGGLGTIPTHQLLSFVTDYVSREPVELIIIGYPRQMNNQESASMKYIRPFVEKLRKALPEIPLEYQDERFTSALAQRTIREAGIGKKRREQDKGLVDEISAVIILQSYLERRDGLGSINLPFK